MGKAIEEIALERNHVIVFKTNSAFDTKDLIDADVAIEFSIPGSAVNNIKNCSIISGDLLNTECGVAFDAFDLITANPPYLPSHDNEVGKNYYAGGQSGQRIGRLRHAGGTSLNERGAAALCRKDQGRSPQLYCPADPVALHLPDLC